ncbi:MAG: sulfite exporter TauE/SafE family protein [Planctomycetota bacterium]
MHDHAHQLTLGLAFGLGALHALEPGHGKTAMLVYLSGERRSFLHPVVMGCSSAIAHSVSLIGIAAVVHLTHHIVTGDHHHHDESVTIAMKWISAGLVLCVGLWMLYSAASARQSAKSCSCCSGKHEQGEASKTKMGSRTSYSMSALLGIAFGLLPCPSAMAAYFTSMSTGSPMAAYGVIGLFGAGIACSITLFGMLVQVFGARFFQSGSSLTKLPWGYIRAALILSIGCFYAARLVAA